MFKIRINKTGMVSVITALILVTGCKENDSEKVNVRPVFYQKIGDAEASNQFTIPGVINYQKEAKLSFKVGGELIKLNVGVGQKVEKGTLLAILNETNYLLNLTQSTASRNATRANVQKAENQLASAESNYLRVEQLYSNNHASLSDYEKAKTAYESSKEGLNSAKSQLEGASAKVAVLQKQLDDTRLVAPNEGTISQILIEENEVVGAGMPVILLSSNDGFEVDAVIPESRVNELKIGQKVEIKIVSTKLKVTGEIQEISPGTKRNTGYPLKIAFSEKVDHLKSGMSVKVRFSVVKNNKEHSQIIIDVDAVSKGEKEFYVYTLVKNSDNTYTSHQRTIEVGDLTQEGYIVNNGLKKGELIATAGVRFLYDGRIVVLKKQTTYQ